jgi:hypothetical protein
MNKIKKVDVRDAYIAGRIDGMKQEQPIDSKPIGYLLWETGSGWWEFVEEKPVEFYDYKAVYAQPGKLNPMNGDQVLEGFRAIGAMGESFILRYFLKGVRFAERHHGIGGKDE